MCMCFNGHFPREPGITGFIGAAKDDGSSGDNWTTGAMSCARHQSNRHHQQTDTQLFTGRVSFLSSYQQCQNTEAGLGSSNFVSNH